MEAVLRRRSFRVIQILLGLFVQLLVSFAQADPGLEWLASQRNPDGSYAGAADISTTFQASAETLRAFHTLGVIEQPGAMEALQFLDAEPYRNTEYLSRLIIAHSEAGNDVTAFVLELKERQNADGGFGELPSYESRILDTGFAAEALSQAGYLNDEAAALAVGFLLARQNPDGGWSDEPNESSVYASALVSSALQQYLYLYDLGGAINDTNAFLFAQGLGPSLLEQALSLLAVSPTTFDVTAYQGVRDSIHMAQGADGSWNKDAYLTAIALRALETLETARTANPPDPTLGVLIGQVSDGLTGLPLEGVTVSVSGVATGVAVTDAQGRFVVGDIAPGEVVVNASTPGYFDANASATIATGAVLAFAPSLERDPAPVDLSISGMVVSADDKSPLGGATVRVLNTGLYVETTADGLFQIANLAPGTVSLEFARAGYVTMVYSVVAPSGGEIDLSEIELSPGNSTGNTGKVLGLVTDALSGTPLYGVAISLSGADDRVTYTGVYGRFMIAGVPLGDISISASMDGYRPALGGGTIVGGASLNFTAALVLLENPARVTFKGSVVDADSGSALSEVSVEIVDAVLSTATGTDGGFQLGGVSAGVRDVRFDYPGYISRTYTIIAGEGAVVDLGQIALAQSEVISDNRIPMILSYGPTLAVAGQEYVYQVQASDPDGDPMTFGLSEHSPGMTIDASTGELRWIPTVDQVGEVSFRVLVADDQGGVAEEKVITEVATGGSRTYVITDVMTLDSLTIDELVPENYVLGAYVSGALADYVNGAPACPLNWYDAGTDVASAADALDRLGFFVGPETDAVLDLEAAYSSITVFPQIDHEPFPQEGIEYTVWGSADPNAPFPEGWRLGTLVSIYARGWVDHPDCGGDETDDYAGLYTFGTEAFRYIRLRADHSISIFNDPTFTTWATYSDDSGERGWQSYDAEIDGVGGMLCDSAPFADAGPDIFGVAGDVIQFDATASMGDIRGYGWDLDGDSEIDLSGPDPQWIFSTGFDGEVTLLVVDAQGCVDADKLQVSIDYGFPIPDLTPTDIDPSKLTVDTTNLQIQGRASVDVTNLRSAPAEPARVTLFEDSDGNGRFDSLGDKVLGSTTMPSGIASGEQIRIDIPVSGNVSFRDNLLYAMVDGDNLIVEAREDNNLISTASACTLGSPAHEAIDISASLLQLTDNGRGQPLMLSARIGNGGPATLAGDILVAFYSGDPNAGGTLLGTVEVGELAPGEYRDVVLTSALEYTADTEIHVLADFENRVEECDEANNQVSLPALVQSANGGIEVATDAAAYAPGSNVQLQANVSNLSGFPGEFRLEMQIEDLENDPVVISDPVDVGPLAGSAVINLTQVWDTSGYVSATYRLRGRLYSIEGPLLAEDTTEFSISDADESGLAVSLRVVTDRPTYNTTDTVQLDNLVRNLTLTSFVPEAMLSLTVTGSLGSTVFQEVVSVGDLGPAGDRQVFVPFAFTDLAEGSYSVQGEVRDPEGLLLASDHASFEVEANVSLAIRGEVQASYELLESGDPLVCTDTLTNEGPTNLDLQRIRQLVVDLTNGLEVSAEVHDVNLAAGVTQVLVRDISTSGLAAGDYACVLQAEIEGSWATLDSAVFAIKAAQIRIDAYLTAGEKGRLLVLVDDEDASCEEILGLELETDFAPLLSGASRLQAQLLDGSAMLIDSESALIDAGAVTLNPGDGEADLTVTDFSPTHLALGINAGPLAAGEGLGSAYQVTALVSETDASLALDSGRMATDCPPAIEVGDVQGDFRVTALNLQSAANDPLGPNHIPDLSTQKAHLKALLDAAGWSYTLVATADAFTKELRSGGYAAYLLLSEKIKLSEQVQKELREAAWRGEGLVEAAGHDQRQGRIDEALGIKYLGKHADMVGLELIDSPLHDPAGAGFGLDDRQLRAELEGASAVGFYQDSMGNPIEEVAVTTLEYGAGHSVYLGFDLAAEAALDAAPGLYDELTLGSLDYAHPDVLEPLSGGVYPIRVQLSNFGLAVAGRVLLHLPANVRLIDPNGAEQLDSQTLSWSFELAETEVLSLSAWIKLPAESVHLEAEIQTGVDPDFQTHEALSLDLAPLSAPSLQGLLEAVQLHSGDRVYKQVEKYLGWAVDDVAAGNYEQALLDLVRAGDELAEMSTIEAAELRLQLARVLREIAQLL